MSKAWEKKLRRYRHYKGKEYEVIGIARHSETLEELVTYRALYDSKEFGKNALWARPKSMFLEKVKGIQRFEFIGYDEVKVMITIDQESCSFLLQDHQYKTENMENSNIQ